MTRLPIEDSAPRAVGPAPSTVGRVSRRAGLAASVIGALGAETVPAQAAGRSGLTSSDLGRAPSERPSPHHGHHHDHHGGHHGSHHGGHHGHHGRLPRADRHLVNRFSYGITPELAKQVRKAGGGRAWFEAQLSSVRRPDHKAQKLKDWWPSLSLDAAELWQRQATGVEIGGSVMRSYERWLLMRRIESQHQLVEVMTEFWENYLNVAAVPSPQFVHRVDYGETIRAHALSSFDTLLRKAVLHPSMLIYLNASDSTKDHPNENLGRELLELHTVGVDNYNEDDVVNSSRILTGWTVDTFKTWAPSYAKENHYQGKVRVKGFKAKNKKANGKKVTKKYLSYLAHHPQTAERIAERLVLKFVGDGRSRSLVRTLKQVYLDNDTQIVPVLQALVDSKAFRRSVGNKLRDPGEDVVATYRLLGAKVAPPVGPEGDGSAISLMLVQSGDVGQMPMAWPSPAGQPLDNLSWAAPGRALASLQVHWGLANQSWPRSGIAYEPLTGWLPTAQTSFANLVDHVSSRLLQRSASRRLLHACSTVTGIDGSEVVSAEHPQFAFLMPRVLATVMDTPEFMSR